MWNISSPARAEKRQGQCPAAAEIYRFLDRLPCFPADYVSFLPVQLQSHQHQLLPAAPGEEPSGVAPVLPEPSRFIQPDRRCVLRNNLQLQLRKARLLRTLDARKRQRPADAFAPVRLFNGNAEIRAVAELSLSPSGSIPALPTTFPVHKRTDFDGVRAFLARLQELCLVCLGKQIFLRIGQQIVRFCVRQMEAAQYLRRIPLARAAQKALRSVF